MSKETGGQAFPLPMGSETVSGTEGMTLRDYFAAKALQAFISRWAGHDSYDEAGITYQRVAEHAYEIADAMLAARNK